MQTLFRRASFLFWQYPILWLPIVVIDPIVFCLNLLNDKIDHAIILSVVTRHSVLGDTPEPMVPTFFVFLKVLLLTKPIDWATHLIALCLYVGAMIAIFNLISTIRSKQNLSLSKTFPPLQWSFPDLVFFSLKLLIAIGVGAIPLILFTVAFFGKNGAHYISVQSFSLIVTAFASSLIAYFMAPAAIKFLRTHNSKEITQQTRRQAGISASLAVIASDALNFFATQIRHSFISTLSSWSPVLYGAVASLVSAIPYIVLFIALSILATDDGTTDANELFGNEAELP